MKKLLIPATALMLVLAGCAVKGDATPKAEANTPAQAANTPAQAAQPATTIDGKKEVAYRCGAKGNDPLRVMYGLQGKNVVAAQVLYKEQVSPVLIRDANSQDDNLFTSPSGIAWSAQRATADNVDKVDGNMLTQPGKETINGKETMVTQIVIKYCKLDKKETAKLNKAAK